MGFKPIAMKKLCVNANVAVSDNQQWRLIGVITVYRCNPKTLSLHKANRSIAVLI